METIKTLPLLPLFFFFFSMSISSFDNCSPTSCSPTGPKIRFPFRLLDRQPSSCGFPGFDLSCSSKNQTLLHLHPSQTFIVDQISYLTQVINIQLNFCSPERITDINLHDTPFNYFKTQSHTFYNCSSLPNSTVPAMRRLACLGNVNHSVFAVQTSEIGRGYVPDDCVVVSTVSVPLSGYDGVTDELGLPWFTPYCKDCEYYGGTCGMESEFGEAVCYGVGSSSPSSASHGIPRGVKYGLSLGIGVPALVCIIGLIFYVISKVNNYSRTHHQSMNLLPMTIPQEPPTTTGLDSPTIQSYPKTVLGENCRLAKDDGTCSICLADYKPKDSIRTIPKCNHCFHTECVDEWLKLKGTCPVCRNSPDTSLFVTPCTPESSHAT